MAVYTEKMHIWEKGILRDIIMVIYRGQMNFIFIDQDIKFIRQIDIQADIDSVFKCTMEDDSTEDQEIPNYRYLALKLKDNVVEGGERNRSHVILV